MSPALNLIAVIASLVGAIAGWTFVFVYRREPFRWKTYEAGRHLMRFTFGLATILTWSFVAFVLRYIYNPDPPWLLWMIDIGRVLIFGWVAAMLIVRLRILIIARRDAKHARTHA